MAGNGTASRGTPTTSLSNGTTHRVGRTPISWRCLVKIAPLPTAGVEARVDLAARADGLVVPPEEGGTSRKGNLRTLRDYHPGQPRRRRYRHPAGIAVWEAIRSGQLPDTRQPRAESRSHRRRSNPKYATPSSGIYSGSGPRMSILYFAATAMSFAISGGVKSLKGTLSSKTKLSNPAGAQSSSIRAGIEPTTLKP